MSSGESSDATRERAGVILVLDDQLALIRRVRAGRTYHLFPGGGVEPGEALEQAAMREMLEETGLQVQLERHVAVVRFGDSAQHYFTAHVTGGTWGAGTGEEYNALPDSANGTYEPVWLPLTRLAEADIRPEAVIQLLQVARQEGWPEQLQSYQEE